jgi:hypothetical protein
MKRIAVPLSLALGLILAGCQSDNGKSVNSTSGTSAEQMRPGSEATLAGVAAGPAAVNLLSAGNFAILTKTGITNTGSHATAITGNIGSSPITAAAMNNVFCSEITGTIYGVDAAYVGSGNKTCFAGIPPVANKTLVDKAVLDMGTAYADAAGRTNPSATELGAGNIGGMTLAPGLYKWSSGVIIPTNVTLAGSASDVWIFQIAGNLSIASGGSVPAGIKVILSGGATASNIFWQVGGGAGATLGTYSTFNGTILSAKQVIIQTGAVLNGRALAQTQVTLNANRITGPAGTNNNVLGEIGGMNFEDFNGDGMFTGNDRRISGWTMFLDANNNGILNAGEASTMTDASGNYRFVGLAAGTYHVREVLKSGWMSTYPPTGRYDLTLRAGQVLEGYNFANFKLGSMSGMKFEDKNGNGVRNIGEGGLPGWTIVLTRVGSVTVTTTTDSKGNYIFTGLRPGLYNLSEVMQAGWTQTRAPSQFRMYSGTVSKLGDFGNRRN